MTILLHSWNPRVIGSAAKMTTTWGAQLQPGDLILLRAGAPIGRRPSACDRFGVVVSTGGLLVEEPKHRVPVAQALRATQAPLVLRPTWPSRAARDSFVEWFDGLSARKVQAWRTPRLVFRLMLKHSLRGAMPLERVPIDRSSWETSRAAFLALDRQGREMMELATTGTVRRPEPPRPPTSPEPRASGLLRA
jgi:hypothetical protein